MKDNILKRSIIIFMTIAMVIAFSAILGQKAHAALEAPTSITVEGKNFGTTDRPYVRISWQGGTTGSAGWKVSRSADAGSTWTVVNTGTVNRYCEDYGISHGSQYLYRVMSTGGNYLDSTSPIEVNFRPTIKVSYVNVRVTNDGTNAYVNLSWTGASGYTVVVESAGPNTTGHLFYSKIAEVNGDAGYRDTRTMGTNGTIRYYRVALKNSYGQSTVYCYADTVNIPAKPAAPDPSSGGSSGGGSEVVPAMSGNTTDELDKATVRCSKDAVGYGKVEMQSSSKACYVDIYRSTTSTERGTLYKTVSMDSWDSAYFTLKVNYAGTTYYSFFTYIMNGDQKVYAGDGYGQRFPFTSKQMSAPNVYATKISTNKVSLHWTGVEGASQYRVYKGSKLVKTTSGKAYVYSAKKAAKYKYHITAVRKSEGHTYTKASSNKTPAANQVNFYGSTNYKSYPYATCKFIVRKISLSGKTYTVTGYAVNNRLFPMKKYRKLTVQVYSNGKRVAKKTYRNKVKVKAYSSKKVVLKFKGKAGVDLHWSGRYSTQADPFWI